ARAAVRARSVRRPGGAGLRRGDLRLRPLPEPAGLVEIPAGLPVPVPERDPRDVPVGVAGRRSGLGLYGGAEPAVHRGAGGGGGAGGPVPAAAHAQPACGTSDESVTEPCSAMVVSDCGGVRRRVEEYLS